MPCAPAYVRTAEQEKIVEGIHLRVPEAFPKDKRIKPAQLGPMMLVFGAMWSFTGRGNVCFASIGLGPDDVQNPKIKKATLCSRSGLSKNTVVKYKKLLIQLGWIEVKREGRGLNDTIILHEIACAKTEIQNPTNCDSSGKNAGIEVFQNPTPNECDSSGVRHGVGMPIQNCTENLNKIDEWEKFLNWSKERLTRSSNDILKNIKINFNASELKLLEPVANSLSMIILKYFTEEVKKPISVKFVEKTEQGRAA